MSETERIKKAYARREKEVNRYLYSPLNPSSLFIEQQRERVLLKALKAAGLKNFENKRILDVGCGYGQVLRRFIDFGGRPENLFGIDLLADRIKRAKKLNPLIDFKCANAEQLPYEDKFFDIAMQFTMFTSILDDNMKRNIAKEMLRVLKPRGIILWYDYHISKLSNPDVKRIKKDEIKQLFPNCSFHFRRITLAPPLTRRIAPYSLLLCYLLEKIPLLCTHYLAVIRKQNL